MPWINPSFQPGYLVLVHTYIQTAYKLYSRPKKAFQRIRESSPTFVILLHARDLQLLIVPHKFPLSSNLKANQRPIRKKSQRLSVHIPVVHSHCQGLSVALRVQKLRGWSSTPAKLANGLVFVTFFHKCSTFLVFSWPGYVICLYFKECIFCQCDAVWPYQTIVQTHFTQSPNNQTHKEHYNEKKTSRSWRM